MEKSEKLKLLKIIVNVYEKAKNCQLDDTLILKLDSELKILSRYFKVSRLEAFFLANDFVINFKGEPDNRFTHFRYDIIGCYLRFHQQFEIVFSNRIILKHISENQYKIIFKKSQFSIDKKILDQFSLICKCRNCRPID